MNNRSLALLGRVMPAKQTGRAFARCWLVHEVMNTDNVAISREAIDYASCAFCRSAAPCNSWLVSSDVDMATEPVDAISGRFRAVCTPSVCAMLGLGGEGADEGELIDTIFRDLGRYDVNFTFTPFLSRARDAAARRLCDARRSIPRLYDAFDGHIVGQDRALSQPDP